MVWKTEAAASSSVLESERMFNEIDEFVSSQPPSNDMEEAKLRIYEAKLKLDKDIPKLCK